MEGAVRSGAHQAPSLPRSRRRQDRQCRAEAGDQDDAAERAQTRRGGIEGDPVGTEDLVARYLAVDVINEQSGEIFAEAGDEITPQLLEVIEEAERGRNSDGRLRPDEFGCLYP